GPGAVARRLFELRREVPQHRLCRLGWSVDDRGSLFRWLRNPAEKICLGGWSLRGEAALGFRPAPNRVGGAPALRGGRPGAVRAGDADHRGGRQLLEGRCRALAGRALADRALAGRALDGRKPGEGPWVAGALRGAVERNGLEVFERRRALHRAVRGGGFDAVRLAKRA